MRVSATIIGGGVIGLAIGRALAATHSDVVVLERQGRWADETSSRNSGVLHAGLYYTPGSLKARLCVEGRRAIVDYARKHNLPHRITGKLVAATSHTERDALEALHRRALANDADVRLIDADDADALQPGLTIDAALYATETGLIDTVAFADSLVAELEDRGGRLLLRTGFQRAEPLGDGAWRVTACEPDGAPFTFETLMLVNAAGLQAFDVAAEIEGVDDPPLLRFARGDYYAWRGAHPFRMLVYPAPVDGGLGVHATLDLGGALSFGPDVTWIEAPDPNPDLAKADRFAADIRRWWPAACAERLTPSYAGVRPKLSGPGEPPADFRIDGPEAHGRAGLAQLFGMESPGLTASLAVADHVVTLLQGTTTDSGS